MNSFSEEPHKAKPRIKHLRKPHTYLCQKYAWYDLWHQNKHHRKVHYEILAVYLVCLSLGFFYIFQPKSSIAATSFSANYDSGSLNADYTLSGTASSKLARKDSATPDDPTDATIASPGYDSSAGASLTAPGQTMKYKVSDSGFNNMDPQKGEIEMNAKVPFDMTGFDKTIGQGTADDVDYDTATGYYYLSDPTNHRIIKTKPDGTGFKAMGTYGTGKCQFDSPRAILYDSTHDYVFVADYINSKIYRTNMDCTEWSVLGGISNPDGFGFAYDPATEDLYFPDSRNYRLVKSKIDASDRAYWGSSGSGTGQFSAYPMAVAYDPATGYLYIGAGTTITKTKWGGDGWTAYGSNGTGADQFKQINDLYYDASTDYLYITDAGSNSRIVKTKFGGEGWTTYGVAGDGSRGTFGQPHGIYYDSDNDAIIVTDLAANSIRTKIDGSIWEPLWRTSFNWNSGMAYDSSTGYFYIVDTNRIIKTKFDKTGWQTFGSYGSGINQFKSPARLSYDQATGFLYITDTSNYRIVKTKFGGEGWTTLGLQGSGQGQFLGPGAVTYDSATDYLYVWDGQSSGGVRIVKTKIDGTGWATYGSYGSGTNCFNNAAGNIIYDAASGYLYIADTLNSRIVKTKFGGEGWTTFGTGGSGVNQFSWLRDFYYDPASQYFYISDTNSNTRIIKTKFGGEGWTTFGSNGMGTNQFRNELGINYDPATDYVYINDTGNNRIVKTKMDGTGWATFGGSVTEDTRTLFKTTGSYPFEITFSNATNRISVWLSKGLFLNNVISDPVTLTAGSWHDFKFSYNNASGEAKIYIDGTVIKSQINSTFASLSSIGTEFYIGGETASASTKAWNSPIDNVVLRTVSADTTPPSNPDTIVSALNQSGGNVNLISGNWYNYPAPYFSWSGASDNNPDYIKDYFVYFGTSASADPAQDGSVVSATHFTPSNMEDGQTYYLRIKARDKEYNVATSTWQAFVFKYNGGIPPTAPRNLSYQKCTATNEDPCAGGTTTANAPTDLNRFSFNWINPDNKPADLIAYYHWTVNVVPTATNTNKTENSSLPAGAYATQQGKNTLYLIAEDKNGIIDYANYASIDFYAQTTAPGTPTGLLQFDSSNRDTKEYATTLKWTAPDIKGNNFEGYQIYRYTSGEADTCSQIPVNNFSKIGETSENNSGYFDGGLASQYYCYFVEAADNVGATSAPSTIISIKPTGKFTTAPILSGKPTASIGASTLAVTWQTKESNHPCEPSVVVYDSTGQTSITRQGPGQLSEGVNHSVKVTGLRSKTDYLYQAFCRDVDGNTMESEKLKISTDAVPAIYDINITDKSLHSAVINFKTATSAESKVYYTTDSKYNDTKETAKIIGEPDANQSVRLSDLAPDTTYYFRITGTDKEGNEIRTENSFATPPIPVIYGLQLQPVKSEPTTTYDVYWTTNVPTSSEVKFTASGKEAKTAAKADLEREHQLRVKELEDHAVYTIVASGRDEFGNYVEYKAPDVTTPVDTRPPKISNLSVEMRSTGNGSSQKTQIVVYWETDELATSMIEYGSGISGDTYQSKSQNDSTLTNTHVVILSEMEPTKLYHLRAVSDDKAGNEGTSPDTSVITSKTQKSVFEIIFNSLANSFNWLSKIFK